VIAARTDIRFAVDRVYKGHGVYSEQVVASDHGQALAAWIRTSEVPG
jgi:hypothetical protein